MLDAFWTWLKDPANQQTLGWIGGGLVAVVGGIWVVVQFFAKKEGDRGSAPSVRADDRGSAPNVRADRGGVAAGGNISNSPINTNSDKESSKKTLKPKT